MRRQGGAAVVTDKVGLVLAMAMEYTTAVVAVAFVIFISKPLLLICFTANILLPKVEGLFFHI